MLYHSYEETTKNEAGLGGADSPFSGLETGAVIQAAQFSPARPAPDPARAAQELPPHAWPPIEQPDSGLWSGDQPRRPIVSLFGLSMTQTLGFKGVLRSAKIRYIAILVQFDHPDAFSLQMRKLPINFILVEIVGDKQNIGLIRDIMRRPDR